MVDIKTTELVSITSTSAGTELIINDDSKTRRILLSNINIGQSVNKNIVDHGAKLGGASFTINPDDGDVHRLSLSGSGEVDISLNAPDLDKFSTFVLKVKKPTPTDTIQINFLTPVIFPNGATPGLSTFEWHYYTLIGCNTTADGVTWDASLTHRR